MLNFFKFRDSKIIKVTVCGLTRWLTVEEFISSSIEAHKMKFYDPTYRSCVPQNIQYVDRVDLNNSR